MPRPRKCRKVCRLPEFNEFGPLKGKAHNDECIILTVDEYEAVRLIDDEGFSQEECSEYMQVARTTVQQIYTSARKKIAKALVGGKRLLIRGGDYCLCSGEESYCECGGCMKHRLARQQMAMKENEKSNENNITR